MLGGFALWEVRVVWVRIRYGIDGASQAVWGHERDPVAVFKSESGGGVFGKCLLGDVEQEVAIGSAITFKG